MNTDTDRLDWLEQNHAYLWRNGYRGRYGWAVHVAAPGGHYREEDTRVVATGETPREALDEAIKDRPLRPSTQQEQKP